MSARIFLPLDKTENKCLPTTFCWTKMGYEAGQDLEGIIARKEKERESGNGIFFWGIGTSLGQRVWSFIDAVENPFVLFSPMKSRAKLKDSKPDRIFAWTGYIDRQGTRHAIPCHALVTSRGTKGDKVKANHFALVCYKQNSILSGKWPSVSSKELRNYGSGKKVGFSQVTSIVEHKKIRLQKSGYKILFGATLVEPFYINLVDPVEIPRSTWVEANKMWKSNFCGEKAWEQWLLSKRKKFRQVYPNKENALSKLTKRSKLL